MNESNRSAFPQRQGYTGPRPDVLALMPDNPRRVLDVGCGAGSLGASIKERWNNASVVGVDNDPALVAQAAKRLDEVYQADLNSIDPFERLDPEGEGFDVIIFADILEHLLDPQELLRLARKHLASQGCVITSLPNVRHYSTFVSLGLLGVWPQRDRGIHDRTHLHFYARKNILQLFEASGFQQVKERRNVRLVECWAWTNIPGKALDFWPFRGFLTFQYLHRLVAREDIAS